MRVTLTVLMSLALCACASQSELAGTWVYKYDVLTEKYELREDGTYERTTIHAFEFDVVAETSAGMWFKESKYVCFEGEHTKHCFELGSEDDETYLLLDDHEDMDMKLLKL